MELQFRKGEPFKIVQFTDVHVSDGGARDERSLNAMRTILAGEKPDLCLFTGDTVFGELGYDTAELLPLALSPVVEAGVPWATVFGNHDTQYGPATKETLMDIQLGLPGCITKPWWEPASGRNDYALSILAADEEMPLWEIYCFDSGRNMMVGGKKGWSGLLPSQIEWYERRSLAQEQIWGKVPALAFMHIPLPEHHDVWDRSVCRGVRHEGVGAAEINSGFFYRACLRGDIRGIFAGHDHINDYEGELSGVTLGYGRISGCNTYPRKNEKSHSDFDNALADYGLCLGARAFLLQEGSGEFETYIALEDGGKIDNQPVHQPERRFYDGVRRQVPAGGE